MMTISQFGALTVGYAGAGLIATLSTIAWAFYLDAYRSCSSALCILLLHVAPRSVKGATNLAAVAHNLRVGLGFVRDMPVLRSLVLVFVPIFISYGFGNALFLPFAIRALGATEFEYSLLEGLFTVGFVVGSLVMAGLADRLHEAQWIAISILGMGLFNVALALAWSVPVAIAFSAMVGLLNAPSYIGRQVLIQRTTPREMRGRVSSMFFVTRDTGFMLGMAAAGLADLFDVRMLLLVNAVLLIGCGLLAFILPGLRPTDRRVAPHAGHAARRAPGWGWAARHSWPTSIDWPCICPLSRTSIARNGKSWRHRRGSMTRPPARRSCGRASRATRPISCSTGEPLRVRVEEGAVRVLEVHNAGDFFGEIAALTGMPRTASVLAEQPTRVLQMPAAALRKLTRDPQLNRVFLSKLSERMERLRLIALPGFGGLDQELLRELRTCEG